MRPESKRVGIIRFILLLVLLPVVMLSGLVAINSLGHTEFNTLPKAIQALCVLEDLQKTCLIVVGAVGASVSGLLFRIQEDADFAKKTNIMRRINYMIVSLVFSVSLSPSVLMSASDNQPKALCLAVGYGLGLAAWVILEVFYSRVKGLVVWAFDKIPIPAQKGSTDAVANKEAKPPASV